MSKQSATIMQIAFVLFFAAALSVTLPAAPCRGSDKVSADPTITLDVQNEPLRAVLGKISKATGWKIDAPDKWMDKPVTQTLKSVSMTEGLRFILKDAGVENLLLAYDENRKTVTVYDTEIRQGQSAYRPPVQVEAPRPALIPSDRTDPVLTRAAKNARSDSPRGTSRARSRRQSHRDEE